MKEEEIILSNIKIIKNDRGLQLHKTDGNLKSITFTPEEVKELKKFLDNKPEISYFDKIYLDKRRILRQLSIKDEIRNYVNLMTDKIWEKVLENPQIPFFIEDIELYHYIKNLLIDGFIAFEIIFDEKQKDTIDIKMVDPCSLTPTFHSSDGERKNDFDWIQYQDNEKLKRVLSKNQIIYILYSSNNEYSSTSYVEELKESYEKVKTLENELMMSKMKLPGGIQLGGKITFNQLKRADKKLQFMSKIPKSILKDEKVFSDDVRYNKFIQRISQIFDTELIGKLIETKNNL